jgi:hypothetical protein
MPTTAMKTPVTAGQTCLTMKTRVNDALQPPIKWWRAVTEPGILGCGGNRVKHTQNIKF